MHQWTRRGVPDPTETGIERLARQNIGHATHDSAERQSIGKHPSESMQPYTTYW